MQYGSLYHVLHEGTGFVVDTQQALKFAIDVAKGMAFLHTLNPLVPRLFLTSKHVMVNLFTKYSSMYLIILTYY
jgi:integrin-linked kinase